MSLSCPLLFFSRWYKSRSFSDCVYKFLLCLFLFCVFPLLQFFQLVSAAMYYATVSLLLIHLFCFISYLPPSNSALPPQRWWRMAKDGHNKVFLFDIIVDSRGIIDGGSSFLECVFCLHHWLCSWEFRILIQHYFWQSVVKGFLIKFSPHCIEICSSEVVFVFFWYYISLFCFYLKCDCLMV